MKIRDRIKEFRRVPASELAPHPNNWRTHSDDQKDAMRGLLAEIGIAGAVIAYQSKDGLRLIDGHLRTEQIAANAKVPTLILDVNDEEAMKILATFDPISAMASRDDEMLRDLLNQIEFESAAVEQMLQDMIGEEEDNEPTEGLTDPDDVPEPPKEPITKTGDLWILGDHRLLCGDSTNAEDVKRLMDGEKAELCFTSPPYNLGDAVSLRNGARRKSRSAYNDSLDNVGWPELTNAFIAIALNVSHVVCVNVQMLAGNKVDLLELFGTYARHTIDIGVWVKTNAPPAMAEKVMTSAFEFMWLLSCDINPSRAIPTASFDRGTFTNVFEHATASGHDASVHGAVFPIAVASHYIGHLCNQCNAIYEPFCGSGTTIIAAEQLNRKCYGMEISPQYCDVIVKRWEDFTGRKAERATQ